MATKTNYDEMIKKYRDIAKTQSGFDITEGFDTPTMGEMIEEDLAYDAMMKILEDLDDSSDPTLAAFYVDPPYSETLGYHDDVGAFVLDAKVRKITYNGIDVSWIWNKYDGDTINFYLKDLKGGDSTFVIAGREYQNIQEYFWNTYKDSLDSGISSSPTQNSNDLSFGIRYVGIDSAEVPHLEPMAVCSANENSQIIEKKIKDIKGKPKDYVYLKYPVEKVNGEYKLAPRSDNDTVKMIYVDGVYKEILPVNAKTLEPLPFSTKDPNYIIPNITEANVVYKKDTKTYLIVSVDESQSATVLDAYKAKDNNKKALEKANYNVRLVLDANSMTLSEIGALSGDTLYYGSLFYTKDVLSHMYKQYKKSTTDLRIQGLAYSLFGADTYGRMLGAVYTQTENNKWINVNKYVYATTEHTANQKDYSDAQESAINGGISDAFKVWTYDKENIIWLDSLEELSKRSYTKKMNLHKKLSGLTSCDNQMRNYTVMIGDTLLMIPPTSIRAVTHTQYEKQPLLRAKGSLVKGGYQNERLLELELFFAGDEGINGIAMCQKFPSGEQTTYYMNGLRALISQFKFAPFLPIENEYINDVLGIEAVSMVNMSIQTVPEYPGLLQVVLTLQEFNYRLFMPDLPIGIEQAVDVTALAETTPVFAMSFQWEAFRYFYQRSLIAGEDLFKLSQDFGYNSGEYNEYLYLMRTCLQPTTACGSSVGFYIPDQNWLDEALAVKKDKNKSGVSFEPLPLTDDIIKVSKELGNVYETAKNIEDPNSDFYKNLNSIVTSPQFLENTTWYPYKAWNLGYDSKYLGTNGWSYLRYTLSAGEEGNTFATHANVIEKIVKPIQDELDKLLSFKSIYSGEVTSSEVLDQGDNMSDEATVYLNFDLPLDFSTLNDTEISTLKEYLSVDIDGTTKDTVLTHDDGDTKNVVRFTLEMNFGSTTGNSNRPTSITWSSNAAQIFRTLYRIGNGEITEEDFNNDVADYLDYRDPAKLPFVPYMDDVLVTNVSVGFSNNYTDTKLKAVDGNASQYLGGTDSMIELKMVTCDELVVSALNALPAITFDMVTNYRQVLPCAPLRVKNEIMQMCGINEALIEMISIDTVPEYPGMYEITMRLSSVDRTLRQRETMRKLEINKNGGFVGKGSGGKQSIKTYFETNNLLAQAELYPDLELPTLDDLRARGYAYIRYTLSNQYRVYPDPDFYMVYGNGYTAAKIKKILEDSFKTLNEENSVLDVTQLDDAENKLSLLTKCDDVVGLAVASQCKNSDAIDSEVQKILLQINNEKSSDASSTLKEKQEDTERHLSFLLTTDVTDGWKIKPGYQAPLCPEAMNDAIRNLPSAGSKSSTGEHNESASQIKIMRKKAIELIDEILSKPIPLINAKNGVPVMPSTTKGAMKNNQKGIVDGALDLAYTRMFENDSTGASLIKLLNPFETDSSLLDYKDIKVKNYFKAFAYAYACTLSGYETYKGGLFDEGDYFARFVYTLNKKGSLDEDGNYIPLCKINSGTMQRNVTSLQEALDGDAYLFGPFAIKTYTSEELIALTRPQLPIKYVGENYKLYRDGVQSGFLDPYYNKLKSDDEELKIYKRGILVDPEFSACAHIRNTLVWIRKMILDGLMFSPLDVIAKDVKKEFPNGVPDSKIEQAKEEAEGKWGILDKIGDFLNPFNDSYDKEYEDTDLYIMLATLSNTLPKSFAVRVIYPFIMQLCEGDTSIQTTIMNRDYEGLTSITDAAMNAASGTNMSNSQRLLNKFFKALEAQGILEAGDTEKTWADESQKMANSLSKQVYVEASNNPKKYVMHSFYDMLMNDKRGRLVRAFPTFYMIVMDEGRKIGYWKLHDNFYNMSSISNIQIVKSRKIPTDTCSITMSNMYGSYSSNYNASTSQQYSDVYGVKDAIDNIFSPTTYYQKSEQIRSQLSTPDTIVIKPGARIHVRLGYGSDASRLPTSFNGKIAEVNVGTVVDIVAQGDGHELCNPLTAFGSIESNQLEPSQSKVTWFKDLRGSFTRGGYSPRDLLAEVLSAEHGGVEEIINWATNGNYFNNNPFGIVHFGDSKFTNIFEQGEVVQNLFEVSEIDYGKGYNELVSEPDTKKSTPIINTSLYDKTFWDLLHMAARAGKDYIGAVRDFGFRSTVFLGRPNDYYAYEYVTKNGNIYEKRKPFQQFHYLDSYNDIIYNTITATEANMKTNATGIWQASGWFSGRVEETVGPVYLDQNIYPEYQKSMTYDTGLLADGNGGFDLKALTKLGETFCNGSEFDDKVNKELARRMTISALRDSVKDMYQGQLCVLGSPAIKPYDRIELVDIIESMNGAFECESVIHSLNTETGFTTTIVPDVIVRDINNPHEIAVTQLVKTSLMPHIITLMTTNAIMHTFFRKQSKIAKALAKASVTQTVAGSINRHAKNLFDSTNIQALQEISPSISKLADNLGNAVIESSGYMKLNGLKSIIDDLAKLKLDDTSNVKDLIKYFKTFNSLDMDGYEAIIKDLNEELASSNKGTVTNITSATEFDTDLKEVKEIYEELLNSKMDFNDSFELLLEADDISDSSKKAIQEFLSSSSKGVINSSDDLKAVVKILDKDDIYKYLGNTKNKKVFDSILDSSKALVDFAGDAAGGLTKFKNLVSAKNFDTVLNAIKAAKGVGAILNLAFIVPFIVETVFTEFIIADIKESFMSWFKNIQTLTVYPMKQHDRHFYAGMSGCKGSVYGAPPDDGWNSIQGMVIQAYENLTEENTLLGGVSKFVIDFVLGGTDEFEQAAKNYKVNLGLIEDEADEFDITNQIYSNVSKTLMLQGRTVDSLKTRARIQSFDSAMDNVKSTYSKYRIKKLEGANELIAVEFDSTMASYIKSDKFNIIHNITSTAKETTVKSQGSTYTLKLVEFKNKNGIGSDVPMLRSDALEVLKLVIEETNKAADTKKAKIFLKSGTRVKGSDWRSTGYQFIIGSTEDITNALNNVQSSINDGKYKVFRWNQVGADEVVKAQGADINYRLTVYPPLYEN